MKIKKADDIDIKKTIYANKNKELLEYVFVKDNNFFVFDDIIHQFKNRYTGFTDFYNFLEKSQDDIYRDIYKNINFKIIAFYWYKNTKLIYEKNINLAVDFVNVLKSHGLSYELFLHDYNEFIKKREQGILTLKKSFDEKDNIDTFLKNQNTIYTSKTIVKTQKTKLTLNVNYDIYDLFDKLIPNEQIPFISIKTYYKILKNFTPPTKWIYINNDEILKLKICDVIGVNKYSDVEIIFTKNTQNIKNTNDVEVTFTTQLFDNTNIDNIVSSLLYYFDTAIYTKEIVEVKGEFLIPDINVNRTIFSYLLYMDDILMKITEIDEYTVIMSQKNSLTLNILLNYKDIGSISHYAKCNISNNIIDKGDIRVMSIDDKLKVNSKYLKINISKCKDISEVEQFKNIFTRILSFYLSSYNDVINKFEEYLPNFINAITEDENIDLKNKNKYRRTRDLMKDKNPELFGAGYARYLCPTKRTPKIIKQVEDEYKDEDVETIKNGNYLFPTKTNDNNQTYNRYYYSCEHLKNMSHFGLKKNTLDNSDKYPLVPCCFIKNQFDIKNSIMDEYYNKNKNLSYFKNTVHIADDITHIYATNKIIPKARFGQLPIKLEKFFNIINPENKYMRIGMERNVNSFLECLLVVENNDNQYDEENINDKRQELLDKFIGDDDMYQEFNNNTKQSIINILKNENAYIDPTVFITLLENFFNVNIFIFDDNGFKKPSYSRVYIKNNNERKKYILIYENEGSDLNQRGSYNFKQCELIIITEQNTGGIPRIKNLYLDKKINYDTINKIQDSFNIMYSVKILPKLNFTAEYQQLDYFNKCRVCEVNDIFIYFITPIEPMNDVKVKIIDYKKNNFNNVKDFISKLNDIIIKYNVINNVLKGLHVFQDNIHMYIPLLSGVINVDDKDILTFELEIEDESLMDKFNFFNKLSRCINEYFIYLFSIRIHEDNININNIDNKYIKKFVDNNCIMIKDYNYEGYITRVFSLDDNVLIKNINSKPKIIISSELLLKKIIYNLKLFLKTKPQLLKTYKNNLYIKDYYNDVRDFSFHNNTPILNGYDNANKWIYNKNIKYILYDKINFIDSSFFDMIKHYDLSKFKLLITFSNNHKLSKKVLKMFQRHTLLISRYEQSFDFIGINVDINKKIIIDYEITIIPTLLCLEVKNDVINEVDRYIFNINESKNIYKQIELFLDRIIERKNM